ncbi:hypothetical protein [Agrobacterium sp.]|uniref:hypothetical protein n=1 Tax=Agrobacterium sp. TaxID=361 RepID=UPI0028B1C8AD
MSEPIEVTDNPIPQHVLDYCRKKSSNKKQLDIEISAYRDFVARYRRQRDKRKRQVMANMLQYLVYSSHHDMKPSHALAEALESAMTDERVSKRNMHPLVLHQSIAHVLTSSTYTKGRGQTKNWKMHTRTLYSEFDGRGRDWFAEWTAGEILGSYVSFGSHRFHVGEVTQRILHLLEDRYGLDFRVLEKELTVRKKAEKEK